MHKNELKCFQLVETCDNFVVWIGEIYSKIHPFHSEKSLLSSNHARRFRRQGAFIFPVILGSKT